MQPTKVSHY